MISSTGAIGEKWIARRLFMDQFCQGGRAFWFTMLRRCAAAASTASACAEGSVRISV